MPNNQMTPQELRPGEISHVEWLKQMRAPFTDHDSKEYRVLSYALNLIQEYEELKTVLKCWQDAFGTTQLTHAVDKLEVTQRKVEQLQAQNKKLEEQIDKLANFIMKDIEGEPSQNQGAVKTAIRIIKSLQSQLSALRGKVDVGKIKQEEKMGKLEELKILHRALFKACQRIADKGQEYHEAKTAENWKEYYIQREKGICEETFGETPAELCPACESHNVNTNGGDCWCAECGKRWAV